jgi:hypothetical protein
VAIRRISLTNHRQADPLSQKNSYWNTLVSASKPIQQSSCAFSEPRQLPCQPIVKGVLVNCSHCRELEQAYEAALSEYVKARASVSFRICSNLAARKNVDMERTKSELEEYRPMCVSASKPIRPCQNELGS